MKTVSRFEADLLHLLSFFLRQSPYEQVLQVWEKKCEQPPCLSRNCVELVQDALAKGTVRLLVHWGGWRKERFLRDEQIKEGRLWERTPPEQLGLSFSDAPLSFLMWATAWDYRELGKKSKRWRWEKELTIGDCLFFSLAHELFEEHRFPTEVFQREPLLSNPLSWLQIPYAFDTRAQERAEPQFEAWMSGLGGAVLEAMQMRLLQLWIEMEHRKAEIGNWRVMLERGSAQALVLARFLAAVEKAGRYDLARFLLQAERRLLPPHVRPEYWTESLTEHATRIADRAETSRAALALVREMPRFRRWEQQARSIGYFDEGYQSSQLWKADWERYNGDELAERAEALIRQMDPMQQF